MPSISKAFSSLIFTTLMVIAAGARGHFMEGANKTLSPYFFIRSNDPSVDQLPLKSTPAADLRILSKAPPSPGGAFLILSIDFSLFWQ
jgi:hypothetical protein